MIWAKSQGDVVGGGMSGPERNDIVGEGVCVRGMVGAIPGGIGWGVGGLTRLAEAVRAVVFTCT